MLNIRIILFLFVILFSTTTNIFAQNTGNNSVKDKLSLVFDPEMIGVTIAYLEAQIGPAKRIDDYYPVNPAGDIKREYQIGPCKVNIIGNDSIKSIELVNISNECSFNIMPFLNQEGYKEAYGTTFGFIANDNSSFKFISECIHYCGKSPYTIEFEFEIWLGSGPRGKVMPKYELYTGDDQFDEVFDNFKTLLIKNEGEDWVGYANYRDNYEYGTIALKYFKDIPIGSFKYER
jgi:hypothetical protein